MFLCFFTAIAAIHVGVPVVRSQLNSIACKLDESIDEECSLVDDDMINSCQSSVQPVVQKTNPLPSVTDLNAEETMARKGLSVVNFCAEL